MVPVKLSTQALPQQFHRREMLPLILDSAVAIQGMSKYLRPSRMNFCTNSNTGFHRIRLRRMFKVGNSTYGISRCFLRRFSCCTGYCGIRVSWLHQSMELPQLWMVPDEESACDNRIA